MLRLKGTEDHWFEASAHWRLAEEILRKTLESWGYQELRLPILEREELFLKLGAESDVVGKQMYRFQAGSEHLALRPEGTSGALRAALALRGHMPEPIKLWYQGPMFRHERPQKGRLRQFHQYGAEIFGCDSLEQDLELLHMLFLLWQRLGIAERVSLNINSLGSLASRLRYREALKAYLMPFYDRLDPDSQRRLESNPLRILDSKNLETQAILQEAPKLSHYWEDAEADRWQALLAGLRSLGHPYVHAERLVRGLDYYNDLVFEWTSDDLGAQSTLCAGGRFDGLASQWGQKAWPALGFSIGMERLLDVMHHHEPSKPFLVAFTQAEASWEAFSNLLDEIRILQPGAVFVDHRPNCSFEKKYKQAIQRSPAAILTVEDADWAVRECVIRRQGSKPQRLPWDAKEIVAWCQK